MSRQTPSLKCFASIDEFSLSHCVADRQHLGSLLQMVEALADRGVFWTLRKVLLVKAPVQAATIHVLGIQADMTVQVPWWVGPHREAFRPFAETLAAELPGGTVYETEKMWRVRCFGRVPLVSDLVQNLGALQAAFDALLLDAV